MEEESDSGQFQLVQGLTGCEAVQPNCDLKELPTLVCMATLRQTCQIRGHHMSHPAWTAN